MAADPVTERYLARCEVDGDPLRDVAVRAPYQRGFAAGVGHGLLPRPIFVSEGAIRAAAEGAAAMFDLIGSLPERLFDGDAARYAAALGVDERSTRIALRGGLRPPPRYGRADFLLGGAGYRFLEANIGSELGGCHIGELSRALLQVEAFRAFADEHHLVAVQPGPAIAAMLRRVGTPVTGGRDPVVAVVEWTGTFATVPEPYRLFQVELARCGITVHLTEAAQLVAKDGKLHFGGEPIDIALRYFMLHEACADPSGEELLEPIFRAHDEGGTVLFTHPQTNLFSYKDNLALLSDPRNRWAFSAAEGALIDRLLPWSRVVADGETDVDGETVNLREYCLANRAELVAKPHAGFGSVGTVAGWEVTDEEWAGLIAPDSGTRYLVQRRVDGRLERAVDPVTHELQDWLPVHGIYITDAGYAGDYIRATPAGRTAVISGRAGAQISCAFAYPDPDPETGTEMETAQSSR